MNKLMMRMAMLFLLSSVSGCATMFNSGPQTVTASSSNEKEGIKVQVTTSSGMYTTKLPATITAESSNEGIRVAVVDPCYERTEAAVAKNITPAYWANLLNGWGLLIDWATGKMWTYQNSVSVTVSPREKCT